MKIALPALFVLVAGCTAPTREVRVAPAAAVAANTPRCTAEKPATM